MKKSRALHFIVHTSKKEAIRLLILSVLNAANSFLAVYFALAMRNVINFAVEGETSLVYRSALIFVAIVAAQIIVFIAAKILSAKLA